MTQQELQLKNEIQNQGLVQKGTGDGTVKDSIGQQLTNYS